jgi:hypothetical protein
VVRYSINIQCWPDPHAVALVERQVAKQQEREIEKPFSTPSSRLLALFTLDKRR